MQWLRSAAVAAAAVTMASSAAVAQEKELVFGLQCDRTGATQTVGVFLCPGYHDYIAPAEQQGWRGRLQDPRPGDRQRVQGAAGHGGARALQEGRGGAGRHLRHAADCSPHQEAGGGQDPRHLAGLRHGRGYRRQAVPLYLPHRRQLLVAGGRRGRFRQEGAGRQPARARRSPTSTTTTRPARSRWSSSRIWPRAKASS